jgi:hypothetical protein
MNPVRHFEKLDDINMKTIKFYYIKLLQNLKRENWITICEYFKSTRTPRILSNETIDPKGVKIIKTRSIGPGVSLQNNKLSGLPLSRLASEQVMVNANEQSTNVTQQGTSGVYVTTKDAYTLTDGPTIFISNEVEKIGKFCLQQANIPTIIMDEIMKKIEYNNVLNEKLNELESAVEFMKEKSDKSIKNAGTKSKTSKDTKKYNRDLDNEVENKGEISRMMTEITNNGGVIFKHWTKSLVLLRLLVIIIY